MTAPAPQNGPAAADLPVQFCWVDIPAFGRQYLPSGFYRNGNGRLLKRALKISRRELPADIYSNAELKEANRFYTAKRQAEWLAGRFAAKSVVARLLSTKAPALAAIEIRPQSDGSPCLPDFPDITISLSHSHRYALCAATPGKITGGLGVDLEKVRTEPSVEFLDVGFTVKEVAALSGAPAQEVYRHWTIKEAYLKYRRRGFNENLHNVEVLYDRIFDAGIVQDHLTVTSGPLFTDYVLATVLDAAPGTG